jgi:hypothetical protein
MFSAAHFSTLILCFFLVFHLSSLWRWVSEMDRVLGTPCCEIGGSWAGNGETRRLRDLAFVFGSNILDGDTTDDTSSHRTLLFSPLYYAEEPGQGFLSRSRERRNLSSTHGRTLRHAFIRLSIGTRKGIFYNNHVVHTATTLQGGRARLGRPVADTPTRLTTPNSLCLTNKPPHSFTRLRFDSRGGRHQTDQSPFRRTLSWETDGLAREHRQNRSAISLANNHRSPEKGPSIFT